MATQDIAVTGINASSGVTNPINIQSDDGSYATGAVAGSTIEAAITNQPGDYGSANTITFHIVDARTNGSVNRAKQIRISVYDSTLTTQKATYTTGDLTGSDATYNSSALSIASFLDSDVIYVEYLEGGGMPDSATVEVDYIHATLDYDVAGATIVQEDVRFYKDDNSSIDSQTALAVENGIVVFKQDENLIVRGAISNTSGVNQTGNTAYELWASVDGGSYFQVTGSSTGGVKIASGQPTDGATSSTSKLTGAGSFATNGAVYEDSDGEVNYGNIAAGEWIEPVVCVQFDGANLSADEHQVLFEFRLNGGTQIDTYTNRGRAFVLEKNTEFDQAAYGDAEGAGASTIVTDGTLGAVTGAAYVAFVTVRALSLNITAVSGLGLNWRRKHAQESWRNLGRVECWVAQGTPSGDGQVTATCSSALTSAAGQIFVARIDDVLGAAFGESIGANTQGIDGGNTGTNAADDTSTITFNTTPSEPNSLLICGAFTRDQVVTANTDWWMGVKESFSPGVSVGLVVGEYQTTFPKAENPSWTLGAAADWAAITLEIRRPRHVAYLVSTSNAANSSSNNLTPSEPAGAAEGDLIIAVGAINSQDGSFTDPGDFTQITERSGGGGWSSDMYLGYKTRGATAGSGYNFTYSGTASNYNVTLLCLRGVDASQLDVTYVGGTHSEDVADDANNAAPGITTNTDKALVLTIQGKQGTGSWSVRSPAGARLVSRDYASGANIVVASEEIASAGAHTPGAWRSKGFGAIDDTQQFTIAITPNYGDFPRIMDWTENFSGDSAVSTFDATLPTTESGDLLIAIEGGDSGLITSFTTPSVEGSWAQIDVEQNIGSDNQAGVAYWLKADGTESKQEETFAISGTTARLGVLTLCVRNWHGTTAPEGTSAQQLNTATPNCPSHTLSGWSSENSLWLAGLTKGSSQTLGTGNAQGEQPTVGPYNTPPEIVQGHWNINNEAEWLALDTLESTSNTVDPGTFTIPTSSDDSITWTIAIRPPAAGGNVTLTADSGTLSLTGVVGTFTGLLAAAAAALTLSGGVAGADVSLNAEPSQLSLTGGEATYTFATTADSSELTLTGGDAQPTTSTTATSSELTLTGGTADYTFATTADSSELTLTGGEATLSVAQVFPADPSELTLTGGVADYAFATTADSSELTLTGGVASPTVSTTSDSSELTLTGGEATLNAESSVTADLGALTLTGGEATYTFATTATSSELTLTGGEATYTFATTATSSELTLTGGEATFDVDITLTADSSELTLTGGTADYTFATTAASAALALTGGTSGLDVSLLADDSQLTLTGGEATLDAGQDVDLTADSSELTLTGGAATLDISFVSDDSQLTLSGGEATYTFSVTADSSELTLTGGTAQPTTSTTATSSELTLTGGTSTFSVTQVADSSELTLTGGTAQPTTSTTADSSELTLTGATSNFTVTVAASSGTLTLTGGEATLTAESSVTADSSELTLTGGDATFLASENVIASSGALVLTGGEVNFTGVITYLTAESSEVTLSGGVVSYLTSRIEEGIINLLPDEDQSSAVPFESRTSKLSSGRGGGTIVPYERYISIVPKKVGRK